MAPKGGQSNQKAKEIVAKLGASSKRGKSKKKKPNEHISGGKSQKSGNASRRYSQRGHSYSTSAGRPDRRSNWGRGDPRSYGTNSSNPYSYMNRDRREQIVPRYDVNTRTDYLSSDNPNFSFNPEEFISSTALRLNNLGSNFNSDNFNRSCYPENRRKRPPLLNVPNCISSYPRPFGSHDPNERDNRTSSTTRALSNDRPSEKSKVSPIPNSTELSRDDTPRLPLPKQLCRKIIIDHVGIVDGSRISYRQETKTIVPKVDSPPPRQNSKDTANLSEAPVTNGGEKKDIKKVPPVVFLSPNPPESNAGECDERVDSECRANSRLSVRSDKQLMADNYISSSLSTIPCGQGDNTNHCPRPSNVEELSSFFSQLPPSLPPPFFPVQSQTEIPTIEKNVTKADINDNAQSPTTSSHTSIGPVKSRSSRPDGIASPPNPTVRTISTSCESALLTTIMDIKKENYGAYNSQINSPRCGIVDRDTDPTSTLNNVSFFESSLAMFNDHEDMFSNSNVKDEMEPMSNIYGCELNATRRLNFCTLSPNKPAIRNIGKDALPKLEKPMLNCTKPLNLFCQGMSESMFNDLESNPTQQFSLRCSNDTIIPKNDHISPVGDAVTTTPAHSGSNGSKRNNVDTTKPPSGTPSPTKNITKPDMKADVPEKHSPPAETGPPSKPDCDSCLETKSRAQTCTQSSILPGKENILYRKYGSFRNIESMLYPNRCPTDESGAATDQGDIQNSCNWKSFHSEIRSISDDLFTILKSKLENLENSHSDNLVCCFQIKDFQSDACINNDKYVFHIENERIDTMKILSKCMSPNETDVTVGLLTRDNDDESVPIITTTPSNPKKKKKHKSDTDIKLRRHSKSTYPESPLNDLSETKVENTPPDAHKRKKRKKSVNSADSSVCDQDIPMDEESHKKKKTKHKKSKSVDIVKSETSDSLGSSKVKKKRSHEIASDSEVIKPKKERKSKKSSDHELLKDSGVDANDFLANAEVPKSSHKSKSRKKVSSEDEDYNSPINEAAKPENIETEYIPTKRHKKKHKEVVGDSPIEPAHKSKKKHREKTL